MVPLPAIPWEGKGWDMRPALPDSHSLAASPGRVLRPNPLESFTLHDNDIALLAVIRNGRRRPPSLPLT
ncbi:hypothetical protein CVT26_009520 [Gymnopilus dilepis]|uniref:Uncharacterized protein n=1 Tax=Gymnopilus dilepis TaxID=231916 RepID=A0A409VJX0_9AGAR|nr:hypothetical protein CVT26_009520 [Gymnopilus dilepis]